MLRHLLLRGAILSSCLGCAASPEPLGTARARAIYDADDRVEILDVDEADPARHVGLEAVAALVPSELIRSIDGRVEIVGPTWAEERTLCDDVRFADQPVVAHCTAVLVGPDLVLTAGHCARLCSVTRIVFGLHLDAARSAVPDADVFDCVDVVIDEKHPGGVDFAWLRLDRPVAPTRRPVHLRAAPPAVGEPLTLVSFPGGVPMKLDGGGEVTGLAEGIFQSSHDAFQASSGGPLLDVRGAVVGVLGGGAPDLVEAAEGCSVPVVLTDVEGGERSTLAERARAALCDASPCEAPCGGADAPEACATQDLDAMDPSACSVGSGPGELPSWLVLGVLAYAAACAARTRTK